MSDVARVLVTGMSGTGKTTVLNELRRRGHRTVDTDCDGWTLPDGLWDEPRMARLLASTRVVVVSGTVENQGRFYDRFDHVVLLSAPLDVLIERVSKRTNNPYGNDPGQQAEIAAYLETVEPLPTASRSSSCRPEPAHSLIASMPCRLSSSRWSSMCWSTSGGCGSQSRTSPTTRRGSRVR